MKYASFLLCAFFLLACEPAPKLPVSFSSEEAPANQLLFTMPDTTVSGLSMAAQLTADPVTGICTLRMRVANNRPDSVGIVYSNAQLATDQGIRTSAAYSEEYPKGIAQGEEAYLIWQFLPTNSPHLWLYAQYRGDIRPLYGLALEFFQTSKGFPIPGTVTFRASEDAHRKYLAAKGRDSRMTILLPTPTDEMLNKQKACLRALLPDSVEVPDAQVRESELSVGGVVARISALAEGDSVRIFLSASNQNDQLVLIDKRKFGLQMQGKPVKLGRYRPETPHELASKQVKASDSLLILRKGERYMASFGYALPASEQQNLSFLASGFLLAGPLKPIFCETVPLERKSWEE